MRRPLVIIARILFLAVCMSVLHGMTAYRGDAPVPTLYWRSVEEKVAAAMPSLLPRLAEAEPEVPLPHVAEPEPEPVIEPEPVEEPDPPTEPGDVFAFMYHDLTTDPSQAGTWTTTPESMRRDLETIIGYGYEPLSIEDYLTGNYKMGQDYFIVTFDDGYTSNLTLAEPLLREMGIPATVFVITGMVGEPGHMTWPEVERISKGGVFTVYSHTHDHVNAEEVTTEEFMANATLSWLHLLEHTGPDYKILSFPNGDYTREIINELVRESWELFTLQNLPPWYVPNDRYKILNRMNVNYNADMHYLVNFSRRRNGFGSLDVKLREMEEARLEAERKAEEARQAALEAARQAQIAARQARRDWAKKTA